MFTAEVVGNHGDIEQQLQEKSRTLQAATVTLISGSVDEFTDYLERTGDDLAEEAVRLVYARQARDSGRTMSWPSGRNQPCWCGSARKYKKCCGAPAITH
ncbi:MAG: SEC-C domain-containing protein [Actinomycetota bacterium]|nr:SEC-C domain-containing protein [Actinomycetota bacterium]